MTTAVHRARSYPPGRKSPCGWQFLRFSVTFIGYMEACAKRFGDVFTLRPYPFEPLVAAVAPVDVHAILTDRERFAGGGAARLIEPVTGRRSVILASGDAHMHQRKLLLPPFHGEMMERWTDTIAEVAARRL